MRKMKLTKYEQSIEDSIEEYVPITGKKREEILAALERARRKDSVLNIRINSDDLNKLKRQAKKLGVKYQTFISEILHKVAQSSWGK
ncbi:MAG: antitoxin [Candidatus Margulisiibacteriota bacterium]|jgi:predicted DNA binding CopG/RHH family protein